MLKSRYYVFDIQTPSSFSRNHLSPFLVGFFCTADPNLGRTCASRKNHHLGSAPISKILLQYSHSQYNPPPPFSNHRTTNPIIA